MKDETIAVVAERHPRRHYGAVNTPVYRTSPKSIHYPLL